MSPKPRPWGDLLLVVLRRLRQRSMTDVELRRASRATRSEVRIALDALEAEGLVDRDGPAVYAITPEGVEAVLARAGEGSGTSAPVTVLFTDVVGSTELLDRVGDVAAHDLLRRHFALLRSVVDNHGGHEIKSLGDGLMVVFADARAALDCGRAMQLAVATGADSLELRVGIAAGEAAHEGEDYFGRPVVVARRLCDAAGAGEVLVAEGLGAGSPAHKLERVRPLVLKGLSAPVAAGTIRVRQHAAAV